MLFYSLEFAFRYKLEENLHTKEMVQQRTIHRKQLPSDHLLYSYRQLIFVRRKRTTEIGWIYCNCCTRSNWNVPNRLAVPNCNANCCRSNVVGGIKEWSSPENRFSFPFISERQTTRIIGYQLPGRAINCSWAQSFPLRSTHHRYNIHNAIHDLTAEG